jgi:Kdo2-lipid IVA lauroyltransferase/acyltransferase
MGQYVGMDASKEITKAIPERSRPKVSKKRRSSLKTNLENGAVRGLLGALGVLPRPIAVKVGLGIGKLAYHAAGRLRRIAERNLEIALPELDQEQRQQIIRGVFRSLGRQLGEFSQFPKATPESLKSYIEYDPASAIRFEGVRSRGKGIIFLTAHLGSWELLSFGYSAISHPLSFLVRPLDNHKVESYVQGIRTRFGNRVIDKKMAARTALRVLRDGGSLGILADLNSQLHEGVFVPFFGTPACSTAGVATLALRTDSVVMPVCCVWEESRGKFVFYGAPPVELERTGDAEQDVLVNTARFTAAIESMIRRYPDQWMWIHKRWKTRPPGEPDLYK